VKCYFLKFGGLSANRLAVMQSKFFLKYQNNPQT
jgi:hypothetical protein